MMIRFPIMVLLITLAGTQSFGEHRSDSGIRGPKYTVIMKDMERVKQENPEIVHLVDYGKSIQGRPLRMMIVANRKRMLSRRPALIMTGSIHGNEYLNIEDRLPEAIIKLSRNPKGVIHQFLKIGGTFVFVPIVNPDGYDARRRTNAAGRDLNRDWPIRPANHPGFKQVESKALGHYLKQLYTKLELRYYAGVDYHCCLGAVLHPWGYKKPFIPKNDRARHQRVGHYANAAGLNVKVGSSGELLWYLPKGTSKDHYYTEYGAVALTYEGRRYKEDQYLSKHVNWWQRMVRDTVVRSLWRRPRLGFSFTPEEMYKQWAVVR